MLLVSLQTWSNYHLIPSNLSKLNWLSCIAQLLDSFSACHSVPGRIQHGAWKAPRRLSLQRIFPGKLCNRNSSRSAELAVLSEWSWFKARCTSGGAFMASQSFVRLFNVILDLRLGMRQEKIVATVHRSVPSLYCKLLTNLAQEKSH